MPLDPEDVKAAMRRKEARRNIERQLREIEARRLRDETTG